MNTRPGRQPCSRMSSMVRSMCSRRLGMKRDVAGARRREIRNDAVHRSDHQMHVDRRLDVLAQRLAHHRTDREIGHVMIVHHVEMDAVGAGGEHGSHLLAESREVGGEDGGGDPGGGHGTSLRGATRGEKLALCRRSASRPQLGRSGTPAVPSAGRGAHEVSRARASRYFSLVLEMICGGSFGPGAFLFQSSVSR